MFLNNVNKHYRIPKGPMDNPDKRSTEGIQNEDKQNKNTTQYALDTTKLVNITAYKVKKKKKNITHTKNK
jgi:hypothetical protein